MCFFSQVLSYDVTCILVLCVGEGAFTHTVDTWFCQTDVMGKLAAF